MDHLYLKGSIKRPEMKPFIWQVKHPFNDKNSIKKRLKH